MTAALLILISLYQIPPTLLSKLRSFALYFPFYTFITNAYIVYFLKLKLKLNVSLYCLCMDFGLGPGLD
jgi:hypothetical protein